MNASIQHSFRILLLCIYVPLSVSAGMLHTDDISAAGSGNYVVGTNDVRGGLRVSDDGFCLACLFTAGQIVHDDPHIPVLSPHHFITHLAVLSSPEPPPQPQAARAPPVFCLTQASNSTTLH